MSSFPSPLRAPRAFGLALVGALTLGVFAPPAQAHFILQSPPSWMSQNLLGSPQKLGPCGDEGGGTPSGTVTAFQAGQTITLTIDEKIPHPGHYRVALAVHDRSELPPEPTVTPGSTPCGSAPIQNPPVFPVLADGLFIHTSAFSSPQSAQITLPAGVSCDHCTLQVIEFMSDHGLNNPGGCFYHHCADIAIQAVVVDAGAPDSGPGGAAGAGAAGSSGSSDVGVGGGGGGGADQAAGGGGLGGALGAAGGAGVSGNLGVAGGATPDSTPSSSSSGGCSASSRPALGGAWLAGLLALGVFARRRRAAR